MQQELLDYATLMNGARLYLLPLTQIDLQTRRAEALKEFTELEQPWYWSDPPDEQGRGGEKTYWDKASVLKDGTDEEKETWASYERNQAEKSNFIEEQVFKYILTDGTAKLVTAQGNEVDLIIDPVTFSWKPPEAWLKRQNGTLPTDPAELKYLFLAPMVRDAKTARQIVSRCNLLAMRGLVTEEDLEKYDAIFQRAMEEAARTAGAHVEEPEGGNTEGERSTLEL